MKAEGALASFLNLAYAVLAIAEIVHFYLTIFLSYPAKAFLYPKTYDRILIEQVAEPPISRSQSEAGNVLYCHFAKKLAYQVCTLCFFVEKYLTV
jgi:hypothetical protein